MAHSHDVCFGSKYTDRNGQEKTKWNKCGAAFTNDKGNISIKLDVLPICTDPKGLWLSLFVPKPYDVHGGHQQQQQQQAPQDDQSADDDSIPF